MHKALRRAGYERGRCAGAKRVQYFTRGMKVGKGRVVRLKTRRGHESGLDASEGLNVFKHAELCA